MIEAPAVQIPVGLAALLGRPMVDLLMTASDRVYWLYLLCGFAVALGVHWKSAPRRSLTGSLAYCFPRATYTHPSAIADYALWFLNNLVMLTVLPLLWFSEGSVQNAVMGVLGAAFGAPTLDLATSKWARAAYTATNIIALDGGLFFAHYLQHRLPLLWEFHKTHHSAEVLTPITVFRMHPVDLWLNVSMVLTFVGINAGLFGFLFGKPPEVFVVNGINLVMFVFLVTGYHLRHSHVWVMYPRAIGLHISSPAMHLIHHSKDPKHANKNFAQIFTFWDRLTGTFYLPTEQEAIAFGLHNDEHVAFRSFVDLYVRPFLNVIARWRRRPERVPGS